MAYFDPPVIKLDLNEPEKFGNVAEKLDVDDRRMLAQQLLELIAIDKSSMGEWLSKAESYLDKIDRDQSVMPQGDAEQRGSGEEGGSPSTGLTLSAVVQFSARATDALLGEPDLAKASEDTPEAIPLASWVSSQLRTYDPDWTIDTDPLIVHMAVTGLAWRLRTFDDDDRAFHSHFLTVREVIINSNVKSIERAPRITRVFQRYPYEIERSIQRKHWVDYDWRNDETDPQAPKDFYEIDLWIDLDGDEIDEPWTITIARDDMPEVVKIKPRWSKKTIINTTDQLFFKPVHRFYAYKFLPDPDGSFFPKGFGWLLHSSEETANQLLASILDTAKSESDNGGIVGGSGFGLPDKIELKGNRVTAIPTERPLTDAFQAFPIKSVSSGSVAVLEKVITLGDRLAGMLNTLENAPASMTATLAKGLIDSGTQVQSAVHRRMTMSMTQEFRSFVLMADAYDMLPDGTSVSMAGAVAVTADPELATEMHRSALGSMYMQMIEAGAKVPGSFSIQVCALRFCQTMRLPNPAQLVAPPPQQPQATPVEKLEGMVAIEKERTNRMKVQADNVLKLTQALKTLVDAQSGTMDMRTALLQMALLEHSVQQLMAEGGGAGSGFDGVAQPPGNGGADPALPPPAGPGGDAISAGPAGGPGDAGPGAGVQSNGAPFATFPG